MTSKDEDSNSDQRLSLRVTQLESLLEVAHVLNSSLRLDEVLQMVMEKAITVLNAEAGSVWLLEEEYIVPKVAMGPRSDGLKGLKLKRGEGIAGQVIEKGQHLLISDVRNDSQWASRFDQSTGFITTSIMCVPLKAKEKSIGCLQLLNKQGGLFDEDDLNLARAFAGQAAMVIDNSRLYTNQRTLFLSMIKALALALALDARDPYTSGHSERVSQYSLVIAEQMGLSRTEKEKLQEAALLHDIGKIGVRDDVLLHEGPLSDEAWEKLKKHPEIGESILREVVPGELVKSLRLGALFHQERYDGKGYPQGAKGEEIPLAARIIAIADTFDAMTTDRPYRKGLPREIALSEIARCAGSQFDPELAKIFVVGMQKTKGDV